MDAKDAGEHDLTEVTWLEVSPSFGSAMPNGSCNAATPSASGRPILACGYPRRSDGTCIAGHPAPPGWSR